MIFAKIAVGLPRHHRFLRIPKELRAAALGVWLAATCYTRDEMLDGFCPAEAVESIATEEVVRWLLQVGLFEASDRDGVPGYTVLKYAEHNETKEQIDERRAETRDRVAAHRQRNPSGNALHTEPCNASVPGSDSGSGYDSGSSGAVATSERRQPRNAAADGAFGMAVAAWCGGVRSVTGHEFMVPRGKPTETLVAAILSKTPDSSGRIEWSKSAGEGWAKAARAGGSKLSVYGFVDWLNDGQPSVFGRSSKKPVASEAPAPPEAKPAAPEPDAITDPAVVNEKLRGLRDIMSAAGVPPWESP